MMLGKKTLASYLYIVLFYYNIYNYCERKDGEYMDFLLAILIIFCVLVLPKIFIDIYKHNKKDKKK